MGNSKIFNRISAFLHLNSNRLASACVEGFVLYKATLPIHLPVAAYLILLTLRDPDRLKALRSKRHSEEKTKTSKPQQQQQRDSAFLQLAESEHLEYDPPPDQARLAVLDGKTGTGAL